MTESNRLVPDRTIRSCATIRNIVREIPFISSQTEWAKTDFMVIQNIESRNRESNPNITSNGTF